jgi:phenylalanyl-tRNA synthetase alpha subunit
MPVIFHFNSGLVCDRGLTLCDLIGVLHDFFSRLGNDALLQQKTLYELNVECRLNDY